MNIQLNVVTCPSYSVKCIRDNVNAPFVPTSVAALLLIMTRFKKILKYKKINHEIFNVNDQDGVDIQAITILAIGFLFLLKLQCKLS